MFQFLIYITVGLCLLIILLILSQPSKQQDALSLLSSDKSSALFKTQKFWSNASFFKSLTAFFALIWLLLSLTLVILSVH